MAHSDLLLSNCLYFTANSLARAITRMAEECFKPAGLSPSHAFLLLLVLENPGIGPSDLAGRLNLAPSTVTRLADSLIRRGLIEKSSQGKAVSIRPTPLGESQAQAIAAAWKALHKAYCERLGEKAGDDLARANDLAARKLEE